LNHLAHAYLSFGQEDLLIGNFIGDFVKGKDWQNYSEGVQQGVLLHRAIDGFTDAHPVTEESVNRIRPIARRFSSPVTDVLYDHLLAINWSRYSDQCFSDFTQSVYEGLHRRADEMPPKLKEMLPIMLDVRFLDSYATEDGMRLVMKRFNRRLAVQMDTDQLMDLFFLNIDLFSGDFNRFFPDLIAFAKEKATLSPTILP
jgi:acyl carrier protein phosphodiesterase